MKLTKDMFDFEKYDYFTKWTPNSDYLCDVKSMLWQPPRDDLPDGLYRRKKPPPRYILLNEGEPLKRGDEGLEQGHSSLEWGPPVDHLVIGNVEAGEIWRRKVQE